MAALLCCYRCSATTRENPTRRTSVASTRPDSASMTLAGLSFMLLVTMVPAGRSAGSAGGAADTIRGAAVVAAARLTPNGSACFRGHGRPASRSPRRGAPLPNGKSQRSGLNRGPLDYESSALPLSYAGRHALARTRTATPFGTTPSRWRVYQFHHQGPCDFA